MTTQTLDSLFARLEAARNDGSVLPPVERWHPERSGDSHITIARDGRWYYRDSLIQRPEMVRLFSTILRRDDDGYVLVTPAEKLAVQVEDAPFVATAVERRGEGDSMDLAFLTNVGDVVVADADHRIEVRAGERGPKPYLHVRAGLEALIARPVYYELVELARERVPGQYSVVSAGTQFMLGEL